MKFNSQAKQIFIDAYNDASISFKDLNKVITQKLQEAGIISEDVNITAAACRKAFESLGMFYKNRKKRNPLEITFEDDVDVVDPDEDEDNDEFEKELQEVEVEELEEWTARREPSKFEY